MRAPHALWCEECGCRVGPPIAWAWWASRRAGGREVSTAAGVTRERETAGDGCSLGRSDWQCTTTSSYVVAMYYY
jgi:hypothetical protein